MTVSTGAAVVAVPDVSGKSPADAAAALAEPPGSRRAWPISSTRPTPAATSPHKIRPAKRNAPRNTTVTISVAVPGTVPDVTDMSLDAAKAAILANGYTVGNVAVTQDGTTGKVARTEPEANAALRPGEAVTIYYHGVGAAIMRVLGVDPGLRTTGYGVVERPAGSSA